MVAQIPNILCIYIELLAPVGIDGEMIVVALVENEADVACKGSFALVVEEFYLVERYVHPDGFVSVFIGLDLVLHFCRNLHLVFAAQEFYRSVAVYLCIEGVGDAILLHDVDIVGYHAHSYRLTYLEMLVVLDEEFVALLGFCQHLVVYSLEDGRGYLAYKLG